MILGRSRPPRRDQTATLARAAVATLTSWMVVVDTLARSAIVSRGPPSELRDAN